MKRRSILTHLDQNLAWAEEIHTHNPRAAHAHKAINIVVGCGQVLAQSHGDINAWANLKPARRRRLRDIQTSHATPPGNRVLRNLVTYAISSVEACYWVKEYYCMALPTR